MNAQVHHLPTARREALPAALPPTPTYPPTIASTLRDSPFSSQAWDAGWALRSIRQAAAEPDVRRCALQARASLQPVDPVWLKKRLSVMALAFGHERDPDRATAWLAETGRLLLDLPGEILATSIDEAIKGSERGFMPAVGQIRAIAEPMLADREREARRLEAIVRLIDQGVSAPEPVANWRKPSEVEPVCTPEEAAAIIEEFGLRSAAKPKADRHHGAPRRPTEADYIAIMGEAAWHASQAAKGVHGADAPNDGEVADD